MGIQTSFGDQTSTVGACQIHFKCNQQRFKVFDLLRVSNPNVGARILKLTVAQTFGEKLLDSLGFK